MNQSDKYRLRRIVEIGEQLAEVIAADEGMRVAFVSVPNLGRGHDGRELQGAETI